jgi:soluble lytic murein transglycosylase
MRLALVASLLFPVAISAAEVPFDPVTAGPYFATGPAADAAARLRLEEYAAAARGFAEYVRLHPKAPDRAQALFLEAYAEMKAGQHAVAAQRFDSLTREYPLLVDYERAWAARAWLAAGRASDALGRGKQVPSSSALDGEARLLRAEAQRVLGQPAEAAVEYRGYLTAYPSSWRAEEARFHLAEALAAAGRSDEASGELRRVYLEAPESWGRQADAKLTARAFTADELARRATALFDAMRNTESEAEWKAVLVAPGLNDGLACVARFHVAQSVFKQRDRWRAAPLFDAAADACKKAGDDDLLTKSLYQGGRSWSAHGDKDPAALHKAASLFERVWREHPSHSYADDARLREAETFDTLKDDARVNELLAGLPDAFPTGDQRGEALWRLAFRAWKKGDLAAARRWLETELKLLPREDGWWEAGRTLYWLARVHLKVGDEEQARTYFARAAHEYPLSFYALLAINRTREAWPERAAALVEELAREDGEAAGWRFRPRALFGEPAFRRGVELARLGLGADAKRELAAAGIAVPSVSAHVKRDPIDADHEELLWLAAVLYDRAGEFALSHAIPRNVLTEWMRAWPTGANRKRWLLAYPRAYSELIEKNVAATGQPAMLELAIVREESAFDPLMESFANAVGLTQLTAAPAQRFANGLAHDRAALRDPAINIAIGARELGDLWSVYGGNAALAIAGYNAGAGAVNKWLRDPERANLMLDEFVESIPYDETRGYTKRVLSSYFVYRWLYTPDDRVPSLSQTLPRRR